jgi:hypothetical protein
MGTGSLALASEILNDLTPSQYEGWELAVAAWERDGERLRETCGVYVVKGYLLGRHCPRKAGQGTPHEGAGRCMVHGGAKKVGRAEGAWLMAHAYAARRRTTPWEALLDELQALSAQVAWLESMITRVAEMPVDEGGGDDALRPGGAAYDWVEMRRNRGEWLAKVSKYAIDAGVAEQMIQSVELQGRLMLEATQKAVAEVGLEGQQALDMVSAIARNVVALERKQAGRELDGRAIEGESW